VIVGRRGPEHAAFTAGELLRLSREPGLVVTARPEEVSGAGSTDPVTSFKIELLRSLAEGSREGDRRIEFRFGLRPSELSGEDAVTSVRFEGDEGAEEIAAGLVVSAIGYRGAAIPGMPFDDARGVIPNLAGRVRDMRRAYVAGWLKRGPSGGIGTNKWCARETVATLLADRDAGLLDAPELAEPTSDDFVRNP